MSKVILYIAQSIDGYIAKIDGEQDWLKSVEENGEDYGYKSFYEKIDVCLLGRRTYDLIKNIEPFPYGEKETYIITKNYFENKENLHFYGGPIYDLVKKLKEKDKKIWLIGGMELIKSFQNLDLIDEYIIGTIPVLLGDGLRLFDKSAKESYLILKDVKKYKSGFVQSFYTKK